MCNTKPKSETTTTTNNNTQNLDDFQRQLLESHNKRRHEHGVSPLEWDNTLAAEAQAWADKLAREENLYHSSVDVRHNLGENLANNNRKIFTGEDATEQWYGEIKNFDYEHSDHFEVQTGHFTQVVWKHSKKVGAAMATSQSGKHYVCARYDPPGNMRGVFERNLQLMEDVEEEVVEEDGTVERKMVKRLKRRLNDPLKDKTLGVIQHSNTLEIEDEGRVSFDHVYEEAKETRVDDGLLRQTASVNTKGAPPKRTQPAYIDNDYFKPGKSYSVTHNIYGF
ncbi:uncharacterized protein [Clytia hemisphaerica]|uniref:uncharacterized protein n=1 Tax=Clytia hemisphaerica TaxID=252671 RepID=UPI0034D6CA7F